MTEHEHCPTVLRTTARRIIAGKVVVIVRGAEHVIPAEEAEDLRDALDLALDGPGPEHYEVVEQVRL